MIIRTSRGSGIIAAVAFFMFCLSSTAMAAVIWTIETVDSNVNVGESLNFNSLAVDNMNNPHIVYFSENYASETFLDLKYAYKSGGIWQIETVDSVIKPGPITLALDSHNNPHISYLPDYAEQTSLKYAFKAAGIWQKETVESGYLNWSSLAVDTSGNPHISWTIVKDLKYAFKNLGTWQFETVKSSDYSITDVSLALDSNGNPHINYSDVSPGGVTQGYATKNGGVWLNEFVDWGHGGSISLDSSGNPHISYIDPELKYVSKIGTAWQTESVDSNSYNRVYQHCTSLRMDSYDNPHIVYLNNVQNLKYTVKRGGNWQIETVDTSASVDRHSLALDKSGNARISYHDATNSDQKYASRTQTRSMRSQFYRSFLRTRKTVWMGLITDGQESNFQDMNITLVGPGDSFQGVSVNGLKKVFSVGRYLYIPLIIDKGATLGQWKVVCISSLPEAGQVKRIEESFRIR
jgi:hypothetical protein